MLAVCPSSARPSRRPSAVSCDQSPTVLGDEHPQTLMVMELLGKVLVTRKSYDDAERTYREALPLSRKVLGEDHPDTLALQGDPRRSAAPPGPARGGRCDRERRRHFARITRIRRYNRLNEPRWTSAFGAGGPTGVAVLAALIGGLAVGVVLADPGTIPSAPCEPAFFSSRRARRAAFANGRCPRGRGLPKKVRLRSFPTRPSGLPDSAGQTCRPSSHRFVAVQRSCATTDPSASTCVRSATCTAHLEDQVAPSVSRLGAACVAAHSATPRHCQPRVQSARADRGGEDARSQASADFSSGDYRVGEAARAVGFEATAPSTPFRAYYGVAPSKTGQAA